MNDRIHIFGASGPGTTTLANALSEKLAVPLIDADEICWEPTEPPYQKRISVKERVRRLNIETAKTDSWILSGSLWSESIIQSFPFTLVIFLYLPVEDRIARLEAREIERYGERVQLGGDRYDKSKQFIEWARMYDTGDDKIRSLSLHEQWMSKMQFLLLRLNSCAPLSDLVNKVIKTKNNYQ